MWIEFDSPPRWTVEKFPVPSSAVTNWLFWDSSPFLLQHATPDATTAGGKELKTRGALEGLGCISYFTRLQATVEVRGYSNGRGGAAGQSFFFSS
ncbi:hypothetical protein LIA77_01551 [Sarocladium implicatum]|nr:hypothetical protein LIA77_01551 [Sarocladium implicatum]